MPRPATKATSAKTLNIMPPSENRADCWGAYALNSACWPTPALSVGLLSRVEIANVANGHHVTYTIASPHEANLREGKISIKSPIALALLNKRAGDVVEVTVPAGKMKLRIERVER